MPFGMGFGELVLVLVIVLVVFGSTKLPQLGDGLGRAIKNFKRSLGALNEIDVTPKADAPKGNPNPTKASTNANTNPGTNPSATAAPSTSVKDSGKP